MTGLVRFCCFLLVIAGGVLFLHGLALADPAIPDPATSDGLTQYVAAALAAFEGKNWLGLVGLLIVGLVALLRFVVPKIHGRAGAFLNSDRGGALLVLLVAELLSLAASLVAHKTAATTIVTGLVAAFISAGGYTMVKRIFWPADKAPPAPDAAITTKGPRIQSGFVRLHLLAPIALTLSLGIAVLACGTTGGAIGMCILDNLPAAVISLLPEVIAAAEGSAIDWSNEIAKLEGMGGDLAACIIRAAQSKESAKMSALQALKGTRSLSVEEVAMEHKLARATDRLAVELEHLKSVAK